MKYEELLNSAKILLESQPNLIACLSNASAFLNEHIYNLNWVGFYLFDGKHLTVGPFQGKVACSTIALGKGVCGEALEKRKTMVIKDVHEHPNHITCDELSNAEVVVPIIIHDQPFGVLDVDSPIKNRFDDDIVQFFVDFVKMLIKVIDKYYPLG